MTAGLGINAGLLDVAVTVSVCVSPGPAPMPVRLIVWAGDASSRIAAGSAIAAKVGESLIGVTLIVNVRVATFTPPLAVPPLSVTVTVITAVPDWLAAGV